MATTNHYRMIDANTYDMVTVNEYNMADDSLPDDWEANPGQRIIGGNDIKRIKRSARLPSVGRSGGRGGVGGSSR